MKKAGDSDDGHQLGIDSVMAIPLDQWSIDVVTPQTVCVQKDGECIQQSLPEFGDITSVRVTRPDDDDGDERGDVVSGDDENGDVTGQVPAPGYYVLVAQYKGQAGPQDQVKMNITYNNYDEGKQHTGFFPPWVGIILNAMADFFCRLGS